METILKSIRLLVLWSFMTTPMDKSNDKSYDQYNDQSIDQSDFDRFQKLVIFDRSLKLVISYFLTNLEKVRLVIFDHSGYFGPFSRAPHFRPVSKTGLSWPVSKNGHFWPLTEPLVV